MDGAYLCIHASPVNGCLTCRPYRWLEIVNERDFQYDIKVYGKSQVVRGFSRLFFRRRSCVCILRAPHERFWRETNSAKIIKLPVKCS